MDECCKYLDVTLQENNIIRNLEGVLLGRMRKSVDREEIVAAVAQAWCAPEN